MRKVFLSGFLLFSLFCYSQEDTIQVEQYCEIMANGKLFSRKVSITVDYGEFQHLFSDRRMKDEQGKVQNFNSVVDALNYMGRQGWKLVNAFPMTENNSTVYHYYFKKTFLKSELDAQ
jgi:hypothetical protein